RRHPLSRMPDRSRLDAFAARRAAGTVHVQVHAQTRTTLERRTAMPASPDVQNYHIGKGIVSFQEEGGSTFTDLGNCPSFVYSPAVEKKEHFSSREGIKTKDFTAITQAGATIKMTLDEITGNNLAFFALAE